MNLEDMKKLAEGRGLKTARMFDEQEAAEIRKNYNLANVIRSLMREHVDIGFETEIAAETTRREGRNPSCPGIVVPYCALMNARNYQRTMTGKTNVDGHIEGNGAAIVATDLLSDEFISPLSAKTILGKAGVRVLDGLRGDISIPKAEAMNAGWINEEDAPSKEENASFSQINGTPHTVAAHCNLTRKLVLQSSVQVTNLVGELLMESVAREVDRAGIDGTGTNGQPLGLIRTEGINTVDGITVDAPTKADVQNFLAAIETANADTDNLKWLAASKVKACLARTLDYTKVKNGSDEVVAAVSAAHYLYEKGVCEDIPLLWSNLCPAKKLILGDWSQLMLCGWGESLSIMVNPYTLSEKGGVIVNIMKDVDVLVRQPAAFSVGTVTSV